MPHDKAALMQAYARHPYYRYGYAAVILLGIVGWGIAIYEHKDNPSKERTHIHYIEEEPT